MGKTPTDILKKTKKPAGKDSDDKPKRNSLLDFIAQAKNSGKK